MPSYPLHNFAIGLIAGSPLISACVVGLRICGRRWTGIALRWEDYLIVVASVLSIALIYPSVRNVQMWHIGIHIWDVDPFHLEPDYDEYHKVLIAFNLIHTPILPLVKASIIVLLLRAGWVVGFIRKALFVILGFNIGACLALMGTMLFMCPPRTGNTAAPTVFNGLKCFSPWQGEILYLFLLSVNLFTDLLICPIPTLLMYRLPNISLRARLTVIISFALGLGATVLGAVRFKQYCEIMLYRKPNSDWTYNIFYCLNHAENNSAIMLACMPTLRTYFLRWLSQRDEESQATSEGGLRSPRGYSKPFMFQIPSGQSIESTLAQQRAAR